MKGTLAALQDSWEQWDSAFLLSEQQEADRAVRLLLETAADLSMVGLPDLSLAVLVRAVESAGEDDFERAGWALEMAERLDPGRPETSFAAAQVAGIEGRHFRKVGRLAIGYLRVLQDSFLRVALRENLLVWSLCITLLAGGLLVCIRVGLHGGPVVEGLATLLARFLPLALSYILALLVTIWPIFLPSGWRWIFFYWVILLWHHLSRAESALLLALGLLLVASPALLGSQFQRVRTEWSAPMRVVRNVDEGRLYSGLFRDLEDLRRALPQNLAVRQLAADLHLGLGQVEYARSMNEDLVARDPRNAVAHNNLGGYYKDRREYGRAIEHFRRASGFLPDRPESLYNLYQVYRDNLAIDEAVVELSKARALDKDLVNDWHEEDLAWVGMRADGGDLASRVRGAVREADRAERERESARGPVRAPSVLISFLACIGVALVVSFLIGRGEDFGGPTQSLLGRGEGVLLFLVPGLHSAVSGSGMRAFGALVLFVTPLVLARGPEIGYKIPWGIQPSGLLLWGFVVVVWVSLYVLRWIFDFSDRA